MKKLKCLIIGVGFFSALQAADPVSIEPDFLSDSFEDFMSRTVPAADQGSYKTYYRDLMKQLQLVKNPTKRDQQMVAIRMRGMAALESRFPQWYSQLGPIPFYERSIALRPVDDKKVRLFLTRLGSYELFTQDHATAKVSFFKRVKSYAQNMSRKVVAVFRRATGDVRA